MRSNRHRIVLLTLAALTASACEGTTPAEPGPLMDGARFSAGAAGEASYVILARGELPARLAQDVSRANGDITMSHPGIGVAIARSANPEFAMRLSRSPGIAAVVRDEIVRWVDPDMRFEEASAPESPSQTVASIGDMEPFFPLQWAPRAISLPEAWNTGARGQGARIAILDGGIHDLHVDIAPNLDVGASASFVPGQPYNSDVGTFWHGTHVAGIAAGAANGLGGIGTAPDATIIGVKVLHEGTGAFSWIINGIIYAATPRSEGGAGADVINLSLRGAFVLRGSGAAQLHAAVSRATTYATQQGVTVIAAAGNDFLDLDRTANLMIVPAQSANVIAVAATAPVGWGVDQNTNVDLPASYTNFGRSAIDLAAAGGDFALPGTDICSVGGFVSLCFAFDGVLSACRGGSSSTGAMCWATGTSMAAPQVAGVAALIIGENGGPMHPKQVFAKLRQSADDLGQPGKDPFFGLGRVNAFRAVR